MLKKLELIEK